MQIAISSNVPTIPEVKAAVDQANAEWADKPVPPCDPPKGWGATTKGYFKRQIDMMTTQVNEALAMVHGDEETPGVGTFIRDTRAQIAIYAKAMATSPDAPGDYVVYSGKSADEIALENAPAAIAARKAEAEAAAGLAEYAKRVGLDAQQTEDWFPQPAHDETPQA